MKRKEKFNEGRIFHVFNKSIANFDIFSREQNGNRFIGVLDFYNNKSKNVSFSRALRDQKNILNVNLLKTKEDSYLKFLAYCIMPDHYHLLVKILKENCLSKYINDAENSYVRFFNLKYKRKGPLWQSSFKAVRIKSDEQLLHISRYIHLNPVTSRLVNNPSDWELSSYKNYLDPDFLKSLNEISISNPILYSRFVRDNIDYQRKLKKIKKLIFY